MGKNEEPTSEPSVRRASRRDLSSVRVVETPNQVRIAVAVPGVRSSDLSIEMLEGVLHVKGETTKNGDVFCVTRQVTLSNLYDAATATATYEDGELIIVVPRKAGKRIPITQPVAQPMMATATVGQECKSTSSNCIGAMKGEVASASKTLPEVPSEDAENASSSVQTPLSSQSENEWESLPAPLFKNE